MDECKPLRGGGGGGRGARHLGGVYHPRRQAGGGVWAAGRGLHSFTLKLDFSNSRTHSWVKLDYTVERRAQVELQWERV